MRKEAIIQIFFSLFNDQRFDEMGQLFTPQAQIVFLPWNEGGHGEVEVLGKIVWKAFAEAFPNLIHIVQKIKTDAYGYVICEVHVMGTQAQNFLLIPNKGHSFAIDQIFIFHFDDQFLINKVSVNWDHYDWQQQLGHME